MSAGIIAVPCDCGKTKGCEWRGPRAGLRIYECSDCDKERREWERRGDDDEKDRRDTHSERGSEL